MMRNNNIIRIFSPSPIMRYLVVCVSFLVVRNNREKSLTSLRYIADVYAKSVKENYIFLKDSVGLRYAHHHICIHY